MRRPDERDYEPFDEENADDSDGRCHDCGAHFSEHHELDCGYDDFDDDEIDEDEVFG
jgi:hypothetical protein